MSRLFVALPASIIRWLGAKLPVRPHGLGWLAPSLRCAGACAGSAAGLLLLTLSQTACGGDDASSSQPQTAADAGAMAQRARLPAMAAAGTQAHGNVAGASLDPPLECGPAECTRPKNIAAQLLMSITGLPMTGAETVACCLDEAAGTCSSAAATGSSCDTVAVSDDRCPGVDLSALANLVGGLDDSAKEAMIGCCTHDMCGLDGKLFGRGCVENAEAKRMLSSVPVIGPLISVPPPRACADGAAKPDAGAPMTHASDDDAGA